MRRFGAFVDRDGTIIVDTKYPSDPRAVELLPGAVNGLLALRRLGFIIVIASNQSGVGRGWVSKDAAAAVHLRTLAVLADARVEIAEWTYCYHAPQDLCRCRKPGPGLLVDAAHRLGLDMASSIIIGDSDSDVKAGIAAGCGHAFMLEPHGPGGIAAAWRATIDEVARWCIDHHASALRLDRPGIGGT